MVERPIAGTLHVGGGLASCSTNANKLLTGITRICANWLLILEVKADFLIRRPMLLCNVQESDEDDLVEGEVPENSDPTTGQV